jgi:hypothetical protein
LRGTHELKVFVLLSPADQAGVDDIDVAGVHPDQLQLQLRKLLVHAGQHEFGAGAVSHAGRVHHAAQQQPVAVHQETALAAANPLPGVVADRLAALGALGRP